MYQELSAKVDKVSYNAAVNMTMSLFPLCNNISAWDTANVKQYQECTAQISRSSSVIRESIDDIEIFSVNRNGNMSIQTELEQILEDIALGPRPAKGFEHAIAYIKNVSSPSNHSLPCSEIKGCLEGTREVVIRLKMINWGMHGLGAASAGVFLAYHHSMLGPYFGDIDGNEWPHIPLHKEPTSLEDDFNKLLTNITFVMSNETLKNISLLDLPAFGSSIVTLRKELKKQFLWPIKMNFALLKTNPARNMTRIFMSYKTLTEDWAKYMNQLDNKGNANFFTNEMENNEHLNFTWFIKADMKTFLTAMAGNTTTFVFITG